MTTASNQRFQFDALVDDQGTGTFRPADFVCRDCHPEHTRRIERAKIDRQLSNRLHCIRMEDGARRTCLFGQRKHILNHTCFIVGEHHGNQFRPFRHGITIYRWVNPPVAIDRQGKGVPTLPPQLLHGFDYARMLDGAHGHQPRLQAGSSPLDEQVIRLGTTAGEDHFGRMSTNGSRHARPRFVNRPPCRAPVLVATRRIAEL